MTPNPFRVESEGFQRPLGCWEIRIRVVRDTTCCQPTHIKNWASNKATPHQSWNNQYQETYQMVPRSHFLQICSMVDREGSTLDTATSGQTSERSEGLRGNSCRGLVGPHLKTAGARQDASRRAHPQVSFHALTWDLLAWTCAAVARYPILGRAPARPYVWMVRLPAEFDVKEAKRCRSTSVISLPDPRRRRLNVTQSLLLVLRRDMDPSNRFSSVATLHGSIKVQNA